MSAAERRWVLLFALGVTLFTSLPYALALAAEPEAFTGFLIGVQDGNSYIAKMLQGAAGDWLFRSPYSTQPQHGALLYMPYLLLGKLLGVQAGHLVYVLAFHLFRVASIFALCGACYSFIAQFVQRAALRRVGLAIAVLGGGLGWLLLLFGRAELFGSMPLDFYSPETFGFLAVFGLPHLVLGRALLLLSLLLYLRAEQARFWQTALVWFALALTHLITAGLGLALIALHLAVLALQRAPDFSAQLRRAVPAALGAAPVLAYNTYVYLIDPYLRAWAAQNQILAPHPAHYIFAYGWLLPFAWLGLRRAWQPRLVASFFAAWLLALPLMLYAPLGLQRRFAEAAWVLLILLALRYLDEGDWARKRRQALLLALAAPSTLLVWLLAFQTALRPAAPIVRSADEISVFAALAGHPGAQDATVLAAYDTGNALPAWAPVRVLIGHGPETVGLAELSADVEAFYDAETSDAQRMELLRAYGIDFVFLGAAERGLGSWHPYSSEYMLEYLQPLVVYGDYRVFQVLPLE